MIKLRNLKVACLGSMAETGQRFSKDLVVSPKNWKNLIENAGYLRAEGD